MIYWVINHPKDSWKVWASGTAEDINEASVEAVDSVLDINNKLLPQFAAGVNVQMYKCIDLDDFFIDKSVVSSYVRHYLGKNE